MGLRRKQVGTLGDQLLHLGYPLRLGDVDYALFEELLEQGLAEPARRAAVAGIDSAYDGLACVLGISCMSPWVPRGD